MIRTLYELFYESVKKSPHNLFLSDGYQELTYEMVFHQAKRRAFVLSNLHVFPNERVLILDEDPCEAVLWLLACSIIGAVFVVLHKKTSIIRMKYAIQDLKPAGIIDFRSNFRDFYQNTQPVRFVLTTKINENVSDPDQKIMPVGVIETDPAFFVYTSGSTGTPKAVICPHHSVLAVTSSINSYLMNSAQDKIGHMLSLSFVYGLYQIFLAMQAQASIIFLGAFHSPLELLAKIKRFQITSFPALRPVLMALSRLSVRDDEQMRLRYITSAGDYLPSTLIKAILNKFPSTQFFYMYGLSECARALYMAPDRIAGKLESVGRPIPGTRAFIMSEGGEVLPPKNIGELVVEGPHIMNGYWNAQEETTVRFIHGSYGQRQLRTGDLFFQDEEGDFYFVGRKDDMIKSGGFRVSPREVENTILAADPKVRECMIYAVDDTLLGQAIHALVVVDDLSHTITEIFARCRTVMEPYLIPTNIQIVNELPTTPSGKYNRRLMKEH